jgi:acyl-CoA synthetase (AMP-forming)/AMP-acid ligase II
VATKPPHTLTEAELHEFLAPRLAHYKKPTRIHLRATGLPRNMGGKLQKNVLREQVLRLESDAEGHEQA